MIHLGERNTLVRIEIQLFTLSTRLETLYRAGVQIPKTEREALSRVLVALGTEITDLENKDSTWTHPDRPVPPVARPPQP